MKLFESHFTTLFYFGFIFSILRILEFYSCPNTARFKLDFGAENPFGSKFVIECKDKTGNRYFRPILTGISIRCSRIAINAVIHKVGQHFTISAETEFTESSIGIIGGSPGLDRNRILTERKTLTFISRFCRKYCCNWQKSH